MTIGDRIRLCIERFNANPSEHPYDHLLLNQQHRSGVMENYHTVYGFAGLTQLFGYWIDWSVDVPINQAVFHSPHYPRNRRIPLGG